MAAIGEKHFWQPLLDMRKMGQINKLIFIKNAVETLGYFSMQLAEEMQRSGKLVYFIDYKRLQESINGLQKFAVKEETAFITFNFIGLSKEDVFLDEKGQYIWEKYVDQYHNILVDHPMYFHLKLLQDIPNMQLYCVDRGHVDYARRFYPGKNISFLPLGGNGPLPGTMPLVEIPYERRSYDLIFTANYVPMQMLERRLAELEKDYQIFYREIIEDLIAAPGQTIDAVMERHIRNELGAVSLEDMRGAMAGMILVDLWVRTFFRGEAIKTLAEAGGRVHVFGADWEKLPCKRPENIIGNGSQISSVECVRINADAKLSLNVMPWFRDGVHDRVLTAMRQKTVSLTDATPYLKEQFAEGEDYGAFSLEYLENLPGLVEHFLTNPDRAKEIAQIGYRKTKENHTWAHRARELMKYMEELKI